MAPSAPHGMPYHVYDVVILGGGLAGLTLALQLKHAWPGGRFLVVEKRQHPVPEVAFKVGESTVELGTYYLAEVLGLREHLETAQLPKVGLRCFLSWRDNREITQRVEVGPKALPPVPSYHIDRGRFENTLWSENLSLGVEIWNACTIQYVTCETAHHRVWLQRYGETVCVTAPWVVDASGRAGLLKRQFGLARAVKHDSNAVWFRLQHVIDPDTWSDQAWWRARVSPGVRRLSTNHFMGRGYWVWFIPLATEATSIGIVADATLHPFHTINRFERALAWLWAHEPQCAQAIEAARGQLRDFRVLKRYAYTCTQVFSVERWCLTGEAGVFADPLYSPGTDFIALGNCFITDLIVRERQGENITQRTQVYNQLFLKLFTSFLSLYEGQYPVMGNSQVMVAKIAWDFAIYWGIIALVFFHQKFCDLAFILTMRRTLQRVHHLNVRMQKFFQVWDTCEHRTWSGTFIDIKDIQVLHGWHRDLRTQHSDAALQAQIAHNLTILEAMAAAMVQYATACMPPDVRRAECVWWLSGEMDALLQSAQEHPEVGADLAHLWLARVAEPLRHGDKGYEV